MARAKKTQQDTTQAIAEAINTPTGEYLCEVADRLGILDSDLKERLASKLDNDDALDWDVVAPEYQPLVDAIARDLEAERSTRKLEPEMEIPQLPAQPEPPIIDDEPQPKRPEPPKKESTALTKRQKEAMEKKEQQVGNLSQSATEVKRTMKRQKGAKSGAQLAAIELAAEDMTYHAVKDQALRREIAIHGVEMAQHADFDPIQYLQETGLVGEGELLNDLKADVSDLLGKYEIATQEIVENSTLNGFNLEDSEALLNELLNSTESVC